MRNGPLNSTAGGRPSFASTQWGLLLAADRGTDTRAAWEDLYRTYCYPVYAFIRRRGHARTAAQDLTHDFFLHLIEKGTLSRADPDKGRFRTFLLGALERFLVDDARRLSRGKRGGGCQIVFLMIRMRRRANINSARPPQRRRSGSLKRAGWPRYSARFSRGCARR